MLIINMGLENWNLAEISFDKHFVHKGRFFVTKKNFSSWTPLQISVPRSIFFYGSEVEGLNNVAFKRWHPKSNEDEDSVWSKNWEKNTSRSSFYCFVLSKPVTILYSMQEPIYHFFFNLRVDTSSDDRVANNVWTDLRSTDLLVVTTFTKDWILPVDFRIVLTAPEWSILCSLFQTKSLRNDSDGYSTLPT